MCRHDVATEAAGREIPRMTILIEAAVESLDDALAAIDGGADRLELCADLDVGGTTPPLVLVATVLARAEVPVVVMIRPRGGDYAYSDPELERMRHDVAHAVGAGAAGVVLGVLDPARRVDDRATRALVAAARGVPVTFHRAIDETPDILAAIDTLASIGAARVLSSGAAPTALEGAATLAQMTERAGDALRVVAGGGVRAQNVLELVRRSRVREVHARCGGDAARIRAIRDALAAGGL
jgi:copper homeostasis protein